MGLFLEGEDGTWNWSGESIIVILCTTGNRKKMESCRGSLPEKSNISEKMDRAVCTLQT
jgi:hypothetical protein